MLRAEGAAAAGQSPFAHSHVDGKGQHHRHNNADAFVHTPKHRSREGSRRKRTGHHHARRGDADRKGEVPLPLFDGDDGARHALHTGLIHDRRLCRRQREAYLHVQHKIGERPEKARALLLSANVLSLSVMASQLEMYQWKVSEAQTVMDAAAILHAEAADASRKSYKVARRKAPPLYGAPKTQRTGGAGGVGGEKRRGGPEEGIGEGHSKYAAVVAAAGSREEAEAALKHLFARKVARSLRKAEKEGAVAADLVTADRSGGGTASSPARASTNVSSSTPSSRSSSTDRDGGDNSEDDSERSSVCSAEGSAQIRGHLRDGGTALGNEAPADAITRLVIVDCFTHEPFSDIVQQLRNIDREYGLELVIVLLLPQSTDGAGDQKGETDVQGPGVVITPQYDMSLDAAYDCGYDLVLTHAVDHVVVDFLTSMFVSSAGRWRSDGRAKAAVSNYVSLKNVLLGRIDIDTLKRLAWRDAVDDADLLEAIGTNTLAMQGETKHYAMAGQKLSEQQGGGNPPDVLTILDDDDAAADDSGAQRQPSIIPHSLPHLRRTEAPHTGVRASSSNADRGGRRPLPLAGLDGQQDVLNAVMSPTGAARQRGRRKRCGDGKEDDDDDGDLFGDEGSETRAMYMEAVEGEIARLLRDNDNKQHSIDLMESEVARLHKTVAILRRKLGTAGEEGGGVGVPSGRAGSNADRSGEADDGGGRAFGRPDSGSLVNVTKEQQIYILKERLEAANERIMALMANDDGGGRRSRSGAATASSRAGGTGSARRLGNSAAAAPATGADARRMQLQRQRKQQAIRRYQEGREAELLALHDMDAAWLATGAVHDDDDDDRDGVGVSATGRLGGEGANDPVSRRRERENTEAAILSLQTELQDMQQLRGDESAGDGEQRRQRTMRSLEEALNRLQVQQQRIQSLEELRTMNENMYKRQISQLKLAVARAASAGSSGHGPVKEGPRKTGKRGAKAGAGNAARGPVSARTTAAPPPPDAAEAATEKATAQKLTVKHAQALAALEERLNTEKDKAVRQALEREQRQARVQQREREAAVRAQLTELYLRIRKPRTAAYRSLLEADCAKATQEARGAWQRLRFILKNVDPTAQRDTDEHGRALHGPIARIADSRTRQRALLIAREHAHYALLAAAAKRERAAAVVDDGSDGSDSDDQPTHAVLLERYAVQQVRVNAARDDDVDVTHYLDELQRLSEMEEVLTRFGEVDCGPALKHSHASRCFPAAVEAAEARQAAGGHVRDPTAGTGSSSEGVIAVVHCPEDDSVGGGDPASLATMYVPVHDAAGLLSSVAKVFHAAFDGAEAAQSPATATASTKTATTASTASAASARRRASKARAAATSEGKTAAKADGSATQEDRGRDSGEEDGAAVSHSAATPRADGSGGAAAVAVVPSAAPTGEVFRGQEDILVALRQSGASATLVSLYEALQRAFVDGYLHPDRMMDVDKHVCLDASVLPSRDPLHPAGGDPHQQQPASATLLAPSLSLSVAAELYLAHRQELLRVLRLLTLLDPLVAPVLEPFLQEDLTRRIEADVWRSVGGRTDEAPDGLTTPVVTLPLLVAADTAVAASLVDLMGTALADALQKRRDREGGDDEEAAHPDMQALSDMMRARTLRYLSPVCEPVAAYTASRPAVVHALRAAQRGRRLVTGGGAAEETRGDVGVADVADLRKALTRNKRFMGDDDEVLLNLAARQHTAAAYTAEDLAHMFSKRHGRGRAGAALTLEDIYLEQGGDRDAQGDGDGDGDGDDDMFSEDDGGAGVGNANVAAMQHLRLELQYLNAARKQRMEELVLRYRLHQRARLTHETEESTAAGDGGESAGADPDGAAASPTSPREVPDFEVKSGSAAWYGMEAAKRVKDILRRRAKPGQIIVGAGGPDGGGGGVGVELSKRTAFPRPPPREVAILQTAQERRRAANATLLPPLRRRGMGRWQQQQQARASGPGHPHGGGEEEEQLFDVGYMPPRDEASLNAFGNVASHFEFDGVDRFMYTPAELTERVMQYRATVTRAASRLGTGGNPVIASRLGPPYYTPILTSAAGGAGGTNPPAGTARARPGITTWTYGVPPERVRDMLASPPPDVDADGHDGAATATLFLPHRHRSSLAEQQQQQQQNHHHHQRRARRQEASSRFTEEPTAAPAFAPHMSPSSSSFLRGSAAAAVHVSPAALAAQHISALLRLSMADPTVRAPHRRSHRQSGVSGEAAARRPSVTPPDALDGTMPPAAAHPKGR